MEAWVVPVALSIMGVLLVVGFPVAFSLGAAGIFGAFIGFDGNLYILRTEMWNNLSSSVLSVVIFFVMIGELLGESRLSDQLYESAHRWLSRTPGGILHTNVIAATIFAACTGVSAASAAALGKIAHKAGNRLGYSVKLNMGAMAAGATLGILIPPSIIMIIYGVVTENSIGQLFMAGIFPGLSLSGLFMAYIAFYSWRHPEEVPRGEKYTLRQKFSGLPYVLPIAALILVILGSIYGGFATPNEAGAVGALFVLLLGLVYRRLSVRRVGNALARTARITAMVLFLIIGANLLSLVMAHSGLSPRMVNAIKAAGLSWGMLFLIISVIYIVLGCFFDSYSVLLLTLPFLYPVVEALGVDGVLFGIMVTILIETGLITPPLGINLYVLDGVVGGGRIDEIIRGIIPFFFILCLFLVVLFFFPQIALWLPSTMYTR